MKHFFLLLISIFFLFGCYGKYRGFYWIKNSNTFLVNPATENDLKKIEQTVRKVALDFGFEETEKKNWAPTNTTFIRINNKIKTTYNNLQGSTSAIVINIDYTSLSSLSISVADNENNYETDFLRALKKELEKELGKIINMKGLEFKRDLNLLTFYKKKFNYYLA